jgi:regulator of RNase E activity RraA
MSTTEALTARLERCYTGAIHDVLRAMGERDFVLPESLRGLDPALKLAGPAWTVSGRLDATLDAHTTLLNWTGLLARARPGSVVVCQPNTSACALMGELSAETLKHRGVRGYVVDGAARDVAFILALRFPVYCRFATPVDIVAKWTPDAFEEPVTIGAVTIADGDYILADRDGILRIPRALAAEVVRRTEEVVGTENLLRQAILDGMDPQEAYLKFGKF